MPDPLASATTGSPPPPDPHLITLHQTIQGLLVQAEALGKHAEAFGRMIRRSQFNARPVDLTGAVAESLVALLQSVGALSRVQAIVVSELLAVRGLDSGMKYELKQAPEPPPSNGDRPAGPVLVGP